MAKQRVLIVDDDEAIRTSTAESLARHDREVRTAESAMTALAGLDRWRPDVVLSDVRMPGIDGLELLQLLTERVPDADVIMMTAFDDMPTIVSAMRAGAVEFLVKPLDLGELRRTPRRHGSGPQDRATDRVEPSRRASRGECARARDHRAGNAPGARVTLRVGDGDDRPGRHPFGFRPEGHYHAMAEHRLRHRTRVGGRAQKGGALNGDWRS